MISDFLLKKHLFLFVSIENSCAAKYFCENCDTKFTHIWSNIEIKIISNIIKQLNASLINKGKIY